MVDQRAPDGQAISEAQEVLVRASIEACDDSDKHLRYANSALLDAEEHIDNALSKLYPALGMVLIAEKVDEIDEVKLRIDRLYFAKWAIRQAMGAMGHGSLWEDWLSIFGEGASGKKAKGDTD